MIAALRSLGLAGFLGLAASLALGGLLVAAKIDARHWHKQSDRFEQLYHGEELALAKTVAGYRAAADQARAEDKANAARVVAEQQTINERTSDDFEKRLAAARAAAAARVRSAAAAADPGAGRGTAMPGVPAAAGGSPQGSGDDGLSAGDALTATEQAIQLDELIKWVKRQAAVDPNGGHDGK